MSACSPRAQVWHVRCPERVAVGFPKRGNHAREALVALATAALLALAGAILVVGGTGELRDRWNHFSFYSRGVLVPIFAAYLAWQVRHQVRGVRLRWSR